MARRRASAAAATAMAEKPVMERRGQRGMPSDRDTVRKGTDLTVD